MSALRECPAHTTTQGREAVRTYKAGEAVREREKATQQEKDSKIEGAVHERIMYHLHLTTPSPLKVLGRRSGSSACCMTFVRCVLVMSVSNCFYKEETI